MLDNRYEKILHHAPLSSSQSSILSGVARSLRMVHGELDTRSKVVESVASGVVAPIAFLFVWWILLQAKSRGIKRLYFLARDGQIFYKVARVLIERWDLDIDIRYVYCSRESLFLPSFQKVGAFEEYWITWGYLSSLALNEICARLRIVPECISGLLEEAGLSGYLKEPARQFRHSDYERMLTLFKTPEFERIVRDRAQNHFGAAYGYFVQEGLADPISYALVDTGWRGSSQYALSELMQKGGVRPLNGITGLYLGLNSTAVSYSNDQARAFMFDWRSSVRDDRLSSFICFEMLFSADHGRTIGYHFDGTEYVPDLEKDDGLSMYRVVAHHHALSVEYASRASSVLAFEEYPVGADGVCRRIARNFIGRPSVAEAELYGTWSMASEIRERDRQEMAPPMDLYALFSAVVGKKKVAGYWPQASFMRGGLGWINYVYDAFLRTGLLRLYRKYILRY